MGKSFSSARILATVLGLALVGQIGCQKADQGPSEESPIVVDPQTHEIQFSPHVDPETGFDDAGFVQWLTALACKKATAAQIKTVNSGNAKLNKFLAGCSKATKGSHWCEELTRPNPESRDIFSCTYGANQAHQLIHPDESTWKNAFKAVQLVQRLEAMGLGVQIIYNWWRPEPYNKNVGGAPGRHPFGTSVDVRMVSESDMEKAFIQLCKWRKAGEIRAVGYYGSTALHFGVGDKVGNTWGKDCP